MNSSDFQENPIRMWSRYDDDDAAVLQKYIELNISCWMRRRNDFKFSTAIDHIYASLVAICFVWAVHIVTTLGICEFNLQIAMYSHRSASDELSDWNRCAVRNGNHCFTLAANS